MCYSYTHAMQAEVECVYCEVCTECTYYQHRINSREGGSWVAVTSVTDCMRRGTEEWNTYQYIA